MSWLESYVYLSQFIRFYKFAFLYIRIYNKEHRKEAEMMLAREPTRNKIVYYKSKNPSLINKGHSYVG